MTPDAEGIRPSLEEVDLVQPAAAQEQVTEEARNIVLTKMAEDFAIDYQRLDRAVGEMIHDWKSADEAREYLEKLQKNPEYHLLVHSDPPVEEIRRRGDLDELFRMKLSVAYSKCFFSENLFKAEKLRLIGYNYLKQKQEVAELAAGYANEPTEELNDLSYAIEGQRLLNLRYVLGEERSDDLDRLQRLYEYLKSGGRANPDFGLDDLPLFTRIEQNLPFRRLVTQQEAVVPTEATDLPALTEEEITQLLDQAMSVAAHAKRTKVSPTSEGNNETTA